MQLTGPDAQLYERVCTLPQWITVNRLGVAVSGGGDSMALMHLLAACAETRGIPVEVATVDHGLRPEAGAEAELVREACAELGLRHETLHWRGWRGAGNLQAEARAARYRLLAGWAQARRLDVVALGHTRDDQAETFVMRLGREAGVDGLASMAAEFHRGGARFWRPVLGVSREALREFLLRNGLRWCDDPSNVDLAFDRVKARLALDTLESVGVGRAQIAAVASNLADASRALKRATRDLAESITHIEAGDIVVSGEGLFGADPEITRRLLVAALKWVSTSDYGPRRAAVADLVTAIRSGRSHTLHGCLVTVVDDTVRVAREPAAVADLASRFDARWDGRWRMSGPGSVFEIRALGDAIDACPAWRETGLPRSSLRASPSVWHGESLVAAPLAGFEGGFSATIDHPAGDFFTSILSH